MDKITHDMVDRSVKMIAIARKTCEAIGEDVGEFDAELNKMCEEWHKKFSGMSNADMMRFMVEDLMDDVIEAEERTSSVWE